MSNIIATLFFLREELEELNCVIILPDDIDHSD